MAAHDDIREQMPALAALVDTLDMLDGRTAGINIAALMEAMKAHEQRGGRVPWK